MKLKIIVSTYALAASGFAIADSYQAELGASLLRADYDNSKDKTNTYGVEGAYYFKQVNTGNVPLAEAAYLGKNSNIFAGAARTPKQNDSPTLNQYQVGAEFYIPESFLYVSGGVSRTSGHHFTDNDWFTSVGITPVDGLLISTSYAHDEGYDANIHAKYVTDIGGGQFINVEAGLADTDAGTYKQIGGDFYFDNTFSVGGEIANVDSENAYTIRTRKFFSEQFSGELSYTDLAYGNEILVGVSVRF